MPSDISARIIAASLFILSLMIIGLEPDNPKLILPVVGIASFAIPVVLSFDDKYNLGTRLDNGEVRKSIAIALTVVYIIMLSLFFINVTLPQSSGNASTEEDQKDASGLAADVQSASANEEINDSEKGDVVSSSGAENTEIGKITEEETEDDIVSDEETEDDGGAEEETDESGCSNNPLIGQIPTKALADIYINFLYIYILIIGFYFGSRVFEDFAAVRMTKELTGSKPEDLLKRRLAMGEISEEDFEKKIKLLEEHKKLEHVGSER